MSFYERGTFILLKIFYNVIIREALVIDVYLIHINYSDSIYGDLC